MIERIQIWIDKLPKFVKNKFFITFLLFFVWVTCFDQDSLIERIKSIHELNRLEKDKVYFQAKTIDEAKKLQQLKSDKENLERFAREQYLMKRKNEDIFVILDQD